MSSKTRAARLKKRNEKIIERYFSLRDEKEDGVRKYTNQFIFSKVAKEFYLSPRTIEDIVFKNDVF